MARATIEKTGPWPVPPNLLDYQRARAEFSWEGARAALDGLPGGRGLNIAHEAVDRHAAGPCGRRVALRFLSREGGRRDLSYQDLAAETSRFANALRALGIGKGDRVFALLGRVPELYVAALGTLKNGSVFCPLFSAFGPEPIRARLELGGGRVLVTSEALYRKKVAGVRAALPALQHVLLAGEGAPAEIPGARGLAPLLARSEPRFEIPPTDPEDLALLHFTSGTTGRPKGAMHVHQAVVAHHSTGRLALDLHDGDVFWCTADPGWVTGTSYGIVSPLANGVTSIVDEAEFDAERWYRILDEERVTVWYTAPTAVRMLMKAGAELARPHDLSRLRFVASVGEPLNPEGVVWGLEALGRPIHDNWWQTETGGIMIANYAAEPVKPGSMGRPLPGVTAAVVRRGQDGRVAEVAEPGVEGELALRPGWPSMFRGYLGDEARYRACFADGWYLTGDLARRDAEGYFWFVGRTDDVIKSAGHLIGPFEVESALLEHPAVAEAAAIGKPDPVALEFVKAFVSLKPGYTPSEALRLELIGHARKRLGTAVAPKEIAFLPGLPRTRSGKIMRRLLKARELGLPEGDLSTLEGGNMTPHAVSREHGLELLRDMIRIRRFEERCAQLYGQGKIRGFLHLYIGEEAVAVGALQAIRPEDALVATYREHGQALVRGIPARAVMAEMYGKATGCSRGRGGSMHLFDAATRFYGGNAIVGGGLPLAVGAALADRLRGDRRVTACFFGDGAVAEGEFHESLNLAALWRLPVLFLCENNLYAMGTAIERHQAQLDLVLKARGYAVPGESVDGMDVLAVESAARRAADYVRSGEGPFFLEARTYRFRAHSAYDPELYRAKEEVERWKQRDPIPALQQVLRQAGLLRPGDLEAIEAAASKEIEEAVAFAEASPWEPVEDLLRDVVAPPAGKGASP